MKKNEAGFTLVELLVSFTLIAVITLFLFQIIILLKDLFVSSGLKTELLSKQGIMAEKVNTRFRENTITAINKCGANCLTFIYENGETDRLEIDKVNRTFQFGDYKTELLDGSDFKDIAVDNALLSLDASRNNAVITIDIPIVSKLFPDKDYGVHAVYQYNTSRHYLGTIVFEDDASAFGHIVLVGDTYYAQTSGTVFQDPGYAYYDLEGNLVFNSSLVTVENPFVNMTTPYPAGEYHVKYRLYDSTGQVVDTLTRYVTVS